ncbi:YceI family protein [Agreia sp. COWG]|uniref:YceI family protein n=1 Tax=Agreia sp. COWG TaxID=2773266 RepID=UPI00192945C3|nr:YceI family protein [Agreia sp. COWG]CAD6000771.1 Polyisoprenoid-binding protein YceI [Agreia sp. COWG]
MNKTLSVTIGVVASIIALGAMAAVAGPIIYDSATASPQARLPSVVPTVHESDPQAPPTSLSELSGQWTIDSGSSAGYTVGAVLNGSDVTVTGSTQHVAGTASVVDSMLEEATVVVDIGSISSDNANRDAYVRGQALDAADYPTAEFRLTSPVGLSDVLLKGTPTTVLANGTLTLHGVTHAVSVPLTATLANGHLTLTGMVPISFDDFDVSPIDLGFVTVEDSASINFSLTVAPR